jgi:aldose sugar dehydrogenase
MAFLPDGRLLITEKPGNLRLYADGELSDPLGGVPKVEHHEQGGLLAVAVDPNFGSNQFVYLSSPRQRASNRPMPMPRMKAIPALANIKISTTWS